MAIEATLSDTAFYTLSLKALTSTNLQFKN